jgi:hypothetical protein
MRPSTRLVVPSIVLLVAAVPAPSYARVTAKGESSRRHASTAKASPARPLRDPELGTVRKAALKLLSAKKVDLSRSDLDRATAMHLDGDRWVVVIPPKPGRRSAKGGQIFVRLDSKTGKGEVKSAK